MTKQTDPAMSATDRPAIEIGLGPAPLFGGASLPTQARHKLVDAINRLDNRLIHLNKRWQDALHFNNAGLIEKYLSNRFAVALYFEPSGPEAPDIHDSTGHDVRGMVGQSILVFIYHAEADESLWNDSGNEKSVLVSVVEAIDGPEKAVPSFIRAYRVGDEITDPGYGVLYGSVAASFKEPLSDRFRYSSEGRFKFIPRFMHRKRDPGICPSKEFADHVIKGALEGVNGVANREDDGGWEIVGRDDLEKLPPFGVVLYNDLAKIGFLEGMPCGLKLSDVLTGPFML